MKRKVYLVCSIIVFLFSIKPMFFTLNYFLANYHYKLRGDERNSLKYILKAIHINPKSYKSIGIGNIIENFIITAITYSNKNLFKLLTVPERKYIEERYRDNFYLQNLFDNLNNNKQWHHLDKIAYYFLGEKKYNNLTISILEKLGFRFEDKFLRNFYSFLLWQGNDELAFYLNKKYNMSEYQYARPSGFLEYKMSLFKLNKLIQMKFRNNKIGIGSNLLESEKYDDVKLNFQNWNFNIMSDRDPFGDGSFFLGYDFIQNRKIARLFNLYISNNKKAPCRGGIWIREPIKLKKSYYIFSFDYFNGTGYEKMGVWLTKGIEETNLKPLFAEWRKFIFIFDNRREGYSDVRPLIRMFGTGSCWIDNVYLGELRVNEAKVEGLPYFFEINL